MNNQLQPDFWYNDLFDFLHDTHGLILLQSEMSDIIHFVQKFHPQQTGATWLTGQYDRLYDQLKADPERRVVSIVDYNRFGDDKVFRDICTIRGETMEFVSRGHGYGSSKYITGNEKELFIALCESNNIEWLDETRAVNNDNELATALEKIANYKHECGCVPCVGQCRTAEALQIEIDGLKEIAVKALKKGG